MLPRITGCPRYVPCLRGGNLKKRLLEKKHAFDQEKKERFKKKGRKQDLDQAIAQEKKQVLISYFFFLL